MANHLRGGEGGRGIRVAHLERNARYVCIPILALMALNITYILGAGASHGALPTVKEMDAAIAAQLTWLKGLKAHGKIVLDDAYSSDLNAFAARAKEYGTFDTYARSLFLLEEKEVLKLLKVHLSFFFAFELFHDCPT